MITASTTMLYVTDTKAAMTFWTEKMGFVLLETADHGEAVSYEVAPSSDAATKFGIHDQQWVAKANPNMNVGFPSLLFETEDLEAEYERLTQAGVTTNPIMEYQGMSNVILNKNQK
ncbi:glyoxalase/bleomycin resistance/extradiol dioxygenase family protein [Streptococcus azizii]|uniref:Glyoxalase/bleomycin resistance/extradiol dioxygenase family protein n=1 Tax=Streptococcus azizii TaxID=1579424 RepID=A0AB36JT39_9STRE|nr:MULTISPECIES: VOC family protein [Streptococcus]MBF0775323.1 VOC family protein [Streptococcus sp. 19428wD3_AN2]ONK29594.1 glyoxalase/bleomycin resistance/extradiol dioxygenase family protein [Streptococcus azizii]ONK30103.1 glyoxalase/bleomycin resistance/extradiol dioxygenase family protein [Streptococcus azizii]ONK30878.1 glyoxalase/bleomycin resistance/extradiol dioxygenase family protein [Streptococcus azizii]TFU84848.1 VOC family protein [Streptococcus sp. AN2]